MKYNFDLKGKIAVITGAERGIGFEIAKGFAQSGASVAIAGMREEEFENAKCGVESEVAKVMLEQGGGRIVNITSMSGLVVNPLPQTQCAYNSSKAGTIMLTKCMAVEWAQRGIRVNGIAPGFMHTPLTQKRLSTPNDPAVKKWIDGTPLGRVGEPTELVGLALYLAGDTAGYTTGTVISVDGGYTCL